MFGDVLKSQPLKFVVMSGITVAIAGCASTEHQPRVSAPTLRVEDVVPGAVNQFSASHRTPERNAFKSDSPITPVNEGGPAANSPMPPVSTAENVSPPHPETSVDFTDDENLQPSEPSGPAPIDLATALEVIAGQNPRIGFAQERIEEAQAQLQSAEVLWVPSIRAGANYNKHEGRIQNVEGNIIETSRGSIYTGLGAQAVGAGSPAVPGLVMNFHLKDAIFQPRIAQQALCAREHANQAVMNDVLLETAVAYMDLLEALQIQAVAEETLANAQRLAELTQSFAQSGQGLAADADRAQTELSVRQVELRRADENSRVALVRLTRLLSQDQTQVLIPRESSLSPIELVATETELRDLISVGLTNRPELTESQFLVREAVQRLRREQYSPLVPSVLLGLSYGGNGGGLGSNINRFGDRLDFDAAAYWEIRNFGYGEQAARDQSRSQLEQARWRQVQVMDQVAGDVAESHAQVYARKEQIELAQNGITAARESYRRNSERITDGQGLPIETLQSLQALDQAQRQYVRAVADYNRAQFRLHRALGWPIESP
ncbi:MAG: TolC family protein [Planctomycetaceae bacterium]